MIDSTSTKTREEQIKKKVAEVQKCSMGMEKAQRILEAIIAEVSVAVSIHVAGYYWAAVHHTVRVHLYDDLHSKIKNLEKIVEIARKESCYVGFAIHTPYKEGHLELIIYGHMDHGKW